LPGGHCVISDFENNRVRKVDGCNGTIHTLAGISTSFTGDGGPALVAQFVSPVGVVRDSIGYLYIADTSAHRVRRIDPQGTIIALAGTGQPGFSGDGGPATQAQLNRPTGI